MTPQLEPRREEKLDGIGGRSKGSPVEAVLQGWVTAGIGLAVLLTVFMSALTWRSINQAEVDADWVAHTHEVQTVLRAVLGSTVDIETGARGFAATGEESFLEQYWEGQRAVAHNLDTLRDLAADNAAQQKRLELLKSQVAARMEEAARTVYDRRQSGVVPAKTDFLEGQRRMDAVRLTVAEMLGEEDRLLNQRVRAAQAARSRTRIITSGGALVAVALLALAGFSIRREIKHAARLRGQLTTVNADLVQRSEESRRAEELARKSSRYARSLLEASLDPLVTISREGKITDVNEATEEVTGVSRERLIGSDFSDYFIEPDSARRGYEQVFAQGAVQDYPLAIRSTAGKVTDVLYNATVFKNEAGQVEGVLAAARDVTERKRAEQKLRASENRYRTLAENLPLMVFVKDRASVYVSCNQSFARSLGIRPEEYAGKTDYDFFSAGLAEKYRRDDERVMESGRTEEIEEEFIRDGKKLSVQTVKTPLRDAAGNVTGILGIFWDITERKRVQEQLRQSSLYTRSLLEASLDPLVTISREGKITDVNEATEKVTGVSRENLIGSDFSCYFTEPESARRGYEQVFAQGAVQDYPLAIRSSAGEITDVLYNATVFKNEAGEVAGIFAAARDITERKRAEEEVRRLNAELEQRVIQRTAQLEAANKELEAFTYSVSHDLRAPLRHISGFSKILTEEYGSSLAPDAQRHLQRIQEGTRRMGLLVDDLLNLGRIGRHEVRLQVTGLNSVVNDVVAELKAECEGRQVEWKVDNLPFVECDPALMRQVFQNLLSNAIKFTRPRSPALIEVGQKNQEGMPVVFVRDNGVGFNMKYADKLFGVFQRLHRPEDFEGTGVGLATVQRIVQKHGGRIWAEAELDKGATFYFSLGGSEKGELQTKAAMAGEQT
jgi:PAS domain S-box-containing protein